ncbi:hypothetical protein AYM40_29165 [Paraburkholderia phytofirmans OLGA172]|uniref:Uncharacterized protein n=1 Tax=Paraburkholderia phytofirmans OLGA172 TaxID=1417228 RepID=A0A160FT52_9BURK|nr:hypothetical protein AYM40_29165 [Paraburkholderia phytofirmans OLGA172]
MREYWRTHKTLPPFGLVGSLFGMSSTASVWTAVRRLVSAGYLVRLEGHSLAPGPLLLEAELPSTLSSAVTSSNRFLTQTQLTSLVRGVGDRCIGYAIDSDEFGDYGLPNGTVAVVDPLLTSKANDVIATMSGESLGFRRVPRNGRLRADVVVLGVVVLTINFLRPA